MNRDNQALGTALGTDMQPAPFKEPNYGELQRLPQVFAEQQRIGNLKAEAAGDLKRAELLQQANVAGEQAKAAGEVLDKYQGYIEDNKKKRESMPYPEFHPTMDNASSLAGLFSIVSVLGIGLGNSGKQSALNAMNAMSGMMNGWQQGRANLFKQEKETFDKEFNRIKALRDDLRKDLSELMQLMPVDKEKAMYKAAELSAKAGSDSILGTYVKTMRLEEASKLLDSMGKMIQHKEEMEQRATQHREDKELQIQLAREKNKISALKNVSPMLQGIRSIENLQDQLRDKDVQQGLKAKISPLLEKINSLDDKTDFEQAVNSTLTATDKTTVFLKDALLASYEIERAAAGGGRLTVEMMRRAGPVLDPTNYTAETYNEILEGRRKQLYNNLQSMGLEPEDIKEGSKQYPYTPYGGTTKPTQTKVATEEDIKATMAANNLTREQTINALKKKGFSIQGEQ